MNYDLAFEAIGTKTNRIILKILSREPKTVMEIFLQVKKKTDIQNRESVYKALEKLAKAGLVEKFYDAKGKKFLYRLNVSKIVFDAKNGEAVV